MPKKLEDIGFIYGTKEYPNPAPEHPTPVDKVKIKPYHTINGGFMETPQFWMDLVNIGEKLAMSPPNARI